LAAEDEVSVAVLRGIEYLLAQQEAGGAWPEDLFTGTGFPRHFYLRYYGYRNYFPLMALGQFRTRVRERPCSTGRVQPQKKMSAEEGELRC
jgi:squalene-hopene/tetraprenyl-beta-curcumene cyclase